MGKVNEAKVVGALVEAATQVWPQAKEYEDMPLVKRQQRVKRKFVAKLEYKHLDKLSSFRIAQYLVKKHELGLLQAAVIVLFVYTIWSNI